MHGFIIVDPIYSYKIQSFVNLLGEYIWDKPVASPIQLCLGNCFYLTGRLDPFILKELEFTQ
jgi:hypothetical protein